MYYDLITSLPHLPHFERAQRLPLTPLRLAERLRRLRPDHAEQLNRALALVRWRPERLAQRSDAWLVDESARWEDSQLDPALREYVAFRLTQQTLLAALRRKRDGLGMPADDKTWGVGPHLSQIRLRWDAPDFGLQHVYPWLPVARERLAAGDALGLERLLMELNWQWLTRAAQQSMFGFVAVVAFAFKWDMLKAWLDSSASLAGARFSELVDKVTNVASP